MDKVMKKDRNGKMGPTKQRREDDSNKQGKKGKIQSGKKLECFICGNKHYAMSFPHHKKIINEAEQEDEEEQEINIAFEANEFIKDSRILSSYQITRQIKWS